MDIPLTVKQDIFNQNIGQKVIIKPWSHRFNPKANYASDLKFGDIMGVRIFSVGNHLNDYSIMTNPAMITNFEASKLILVKKSIEDITDEDAFEAAKICNIGYYSKNFNKTTFTYILKTSIESDVLTAKLYQYLHLKGYALPYMQYSVKELIESEIYYIEHP